MQPQYFKHLGISALLACVTFGGTTFGREPSALIDPELIGTWKYEALGFIHDTATFSEDGQYSSKNVMNNVVFVDIDAEYEIDMASNPKRILMKLTRVDPKQVNSHWKVGDEFYCIYRIIDGHTMVTGCSDINVRTYPENFDESMAHEKQ